MSLILIIGNGGQMKALLLLFMLTSLQWNAPTTNQDGTPLTDLAGYKLKAGTTTKTYPNSVDVGNVLSYAVTPQSGWNFYAVTAYDTSGNESGYSNEVVVLNGGVIDIAVDTQFDALRIEDGVLTVSNGTLTIGGTP